MSFAVLVLLLLPAALARAAPIKKAVTATTPKPSPDSTHFADLVQTLGMKPPEGAGKAAQDAAQALVEHLAAEAVAQNPSLAASNATYAAAQSAVNGATAAYHPIVALTAGASRSTERDVVLPGFSKSTSRDAGITLRENLYRGGADALGVDIANAELRLATAARDQDTVALRFSVKMALLSYNQAAMQETLATASEIEAAALSKISERKFAAGQVGRIDVHTAAQREAEAKSSAVTARLQRTTAFYSVLRAAGVATLREEELRPLERAALPFPRQRPALAGGAAPTFGEISAVANADKAEMTLSKSYRSRLAPAVDFVASATRASDKQTYEDFAAGTAGASARDANGERVATKLAVEITWQLWDRPKDYAIARAAAEADQTRARASVAKNEAMIGSAELMRHIGELYAALPPYEAAFEQAEKVYEAQVMLYDAGAVEQAQVNNADADRVRAMQAWFGATQEIRTSLVRSEALKAGYLPP